MTEGLARRPRLAASTQGGEAGSSDVPQLSESGLNLFSLMEDISDRLKLLDYERLFLAPKSSALQLKPLSRLYFALPGAPSEQFPYFAHLCTWLFSLCKREVLEWNEFDDPSTIASTIVDHLHRIGCPLDFPASRMRPGSGEAVILVLDFLSALALQHSNFTVLTPIYGTVDPSTTSLPPSSSNPPTGAADADDEGEDDDAVQDAVDDEAVLDDDGAASASLNDPFSSISSAAPLPPPPPPLDASQWSLEYEQAAPLLRAHPSSLSTKEWRAHHDSAVRHQQLLMGQVDAVRVELERLSLVLRGAVERVGSKEKWLNAEYEGLVGEMRGLQGEHEKMQAAYGGQSEELSKLTRRLRECGEEVECMKEQIGRKNERMQDTQPVRAVTAAVKELRREVTEMEVRIGVMAQSVSAIRQRRQREKERQKGKEERERGRKGNGKNVRIDNNAGQQQLRYEY